MTEFFTIVTRRSELTEFLVDRRNPCSAGLQSFERLCNVDQFCRRHIVDDR